MAAAKKSGNYKLVTTTGETVVIHTPAVPRWKGERLDIKAARKEALAGGSRAGYTRDENKELVRGSVQSLINRTNVQVAGPGKATLRQVGHTVYLMPASYTTGKHEADLERELKKVTRELEEANKLIHKMEQINKEIADLVARQNETASRHGMKG